MITKSEVIIHGVFDGDLPEPIASRFRQSGSIAWDIETSGLDFREHSIGLCQLSSGDEVAIVQIGGRVPDTLVGLVSDPSVLKIFHHAMFDLRFMMHHWGVRPDNIACTKIAAKILGCRNGTGCGLKDLLQTYLGREIDKGLQRSDWTSARLSKEQLDYAAEEVMYLSRLLVTLERELERHGLLRLATACFAHIPTRVELEVSGYEDVFGY